VYFGNDLASLIAKVKTVTIQPYVGDSYNMVLNGFSTYSEYAFKSLSNITASDYAQSLTESQTDI